MPFHLKRLAKHCLVAIGLEKAMQSLSRWRWVRTVGGLKVLPSGVSCSVHTFDDWLIFHEIFELKAYDRAIEAFIDQTPGDSPALVLDLGGNVGFFGLAVLNSWILSGRDAQKLRVISVEASPANCHNMEAHRAKNAHLGLTWLIVQGLAGKRSGSEWMGGSEGHYAVRVGGAEGGQGFRADYLDLDRLMDGAPVIHLLKCDIEGSECELLAQYYDLIRRAKLVCMEIHGDQRASLITGQFQSLGFGSQITLVEQGASGPAGPTCTILFSQCQL